MINVSTFKNVDEEDVLKVRAIFCDAAVAAWGWLPSPFTNSNHRAYVVLFADHAVFAWWGRVVL